MSGLRERNKARRCEDILDAALELFGTSDIESVTVEQIAVQAEVSLATIYNLIGTRDELLIALLERVGAAVNATLSEKATKTETDPISASRMIVDQWAAALIGESRAYRQVAVAVGQFSLKTNNPTLDPSKSHAESMIHAQTLGIVLEGLDPHALGRQIYLTFIAAMYAWGSGMLSDRGFSIAARHGLVTVLAAAATDEHRDGFLAELGTLGGDLARVAWKMA